MKKENNYKFIAVNCLCNYGGIVIIETDGEKIKSGFNFGNGCENVRTTKLYYDPVTGADYFKRYGVKYFLSDFMRTDI